MASQKAGALSSRISTVLSASFADAEIKETLRTLDERKTSNNAETRRNLRLDVSAELLRHNGVVINDFKSLATQLHRVGDLIGSLQKCCDGMKTHLKSAHRENAPILDEISTMVDQKNEVEKKQQLLTAFHKHFILSEDELLILTSSSKPIDEAFFLTLNRAKVIQRDCQVLLGTDNQRLGVELLEQSNRNLNAAYQRLLRWTQNDFKNIDLENPQIGRLIRQALRHLAERPALFRTCLDFFASARGGVLADGFFTAVTGTPTEHSKQIPVKPIELFAHDPLRYVGDMLAWIHSAAVSEYEALETLFVSDSDDLRKGIEAGKAAEPWLANMTETYDGRKELEDLVCRDLAGVSQLLRQKVEQILQTHDNSLTLYKLSNLISFYSTTFVKLLGQEAPLLTLLADLSATAMRQFTTVTSDNVISINAENIDHNHDCSIPPFLQDALREFSDCLTSFDSSITPISTTGTPAGDRKDRFAIITAQALDPYLHICTQMAKSVSEPTSSIFRANCLLAADRILQPYDFVATRRVQITSSLATIRETLIRYQHTYLLQTSGLDNLFTALKPTEQATEEILLAYRSSALLSPDALSNASERLDDFLPSGLMDALENLDRLIDREMAHQITAVAAESYCVDFEAIERRLTAIDALEEDAEDERTEARLRDYFPRTSGEIRVLLS